ncbi:MAG: hypothetical protein LC650_00685 [Actinobacteria bacterium]|nr:hypothetical protein [Actinomycetota bacterium]
MTSWTNGYQDADLWDLNQGSQDLTFPGLTGIGGMPHGGSVLDGGTYIISRRGDEVLTPEGWFHISELQDDVEDEFGLEESWEQL